MTRPRALVVTGGIFHDFPETGALLTELLADAGFDADHREGTASGLEQFALTPVKLLVLNALAWTMVQNEKYAPFRADYAYDIPESVRAAICSHLARGGGLLGIHTSAICFDTWPDWGAVLGAGWIWGRSHHPSPGPVTVAMDPADHPVTRGLGPFSLTDELYCAMNLAPDAQVLARAITPGIVEPQPVLTVRAQGAGRVVYSALGHDAESLKVPEHRALLTRAALWASQRD